MNIYIKAMEIGSDNITGITYKDLKVDSLKTMYSNNKLAFVDVENQKQMNNRLSFQVNNTDINYKKT